MSNVIELSREIKAGAVSFWVKGCSVSICPPEDRTLTVNELSEIFDEAKRAAIMTLSLDPEMVRAAFQEIEKAKAQDEQEPRS